MQEFLQKIFPPEIVTLIVSALPISELRGGIPTALFAFNFSVYKAVILAIIGNLIPIYPILLFLEYIAGILQRKFNWAKKFFMWLFKKTATKAKQVEKYGVPGLILLVAIPLPFTGAWTGSIVAFMVGMRKNIAFLSISVGVLIAAIIVTLACLGIISLNLG